MNEITKKLADNVLKSFMPAIEEMARKGATSDQIVKAFQNQVRMKESQYYSALRAPQRIGDTITAFLSQKTADSKAETIFYSMLRENGMKFEFQRQIGPYRVDFLFWGFLVVELDGPHHTVGRDDKRDAYLKSMGYMILRIPLWILEADPKAVIDEIMELQPKKKKRAAK